MTSYSRIVLIDDNDDDNFIHQRFLELARWGGDFVIYRDAVEAAEALPTLEPGPQLMFVDLNMPALNGFELLEQLSGTAFDFSDCKVVILTSSIHPDDRQRAEGHGVVRAYMEKPLNLSALEKLTHILA